MRSQQPKIFDAICCCASTASTPHSLSKSRSSAEASGGSLKPIVVSGDPPTVVSAPGRRIVAVGDLHGDLDKARYALQMAGVLSSDGQDLWVGGQTVLVQLGDILDRGEDEIAILSLLKSLDIQAKANGGAVFQVNGNHETMNVDGDFRYVDSGAFDECADFLEHLEICGHNWEAAFVGWVGVSNRWKEDRKLHQNYWGPWDLVKPAKPSQCICLGRVSSAIVTLQEKLFHCLIPCSPGGNGQRQKGVISRSILLRPGGPLASELARHSVVLKVNDWVFCHGGLLPHHVEYGIERMNREVSYWMKGLSMDYDYPQIPFLATRGYDSIQSILRETLQAVGAKAMVVGHTPQATGVNCEFNCSIWRIDVGMSSGVLDSSPEVLEIREGRARAIRSRKDRYFPLSMSKTQWFLEHKLLLLLHLLENITAVNLHIQSYMQNKDLMVI
ncbi:hypothetical protein DH2020_024443 [Rehmannia glutinosa]|uniref:Calcineurin-like phosphoesterase domain-containing protein n=1 Tax=Rehmannia glutinosa TaxID=99300 RepID=A0ABR0W3B5_REHGL